MIFPTVSVIKPINPMLVSNSKVLTIQVIRRLKLAVFTWKGFTPTDVFREGTIQTLETLRMYPDVNRILLHTRDHQMVMHQDIDTSVNSTVDYLGVAKTNYKMAVIPPLDILASSSINYYADSLNNALKKRFVVKVIGTVRQALFWLIVPKLWYWLKGKP